MRGKDTFSIGIRCAEGITPAHAGKRSQERQDPVERRDHPRACGEKSIKHIFASCPVGSPPRMRGKAMADDVGHTMTRITPAHAGKSNASASIVRIVQDHPRACGEKFNRIAKPFREQGSPPRMRGKVQAISIIQTVRRITPAHAGKSQMYKNHTSKPKDHPRACGEK